MSKILKYIRLSIVNIWQTRSRTFLTMLGIIIGVGAVVLITALGRGAESYILGSVSSFGSNLIYIEPGSPDQGLSGVITTPDRIKYRDYESLKRVDFVQNITPFLVYDAIIGAGNESEIKEIIGTTKGYTDAFNFYPQKGRFIDDGDVNSSNKVAVLGIKVAAKLFNASDPMGQKVKIQNQYYTVVGLMQEQGGNAFESYDDMVFIPITTMQHFLLSVDYVQTIIVTAVGNVDDAVIKLRDVMRNLHNIHNPEDDLSKDDFNILSQEQALGIFNQVSSVLTLFIVAIASISLIVGGIGIMNIMFVAVHHRTREIGLRKAVGATNYDIFLQFLIEAILITFLGGIIGIVGGVALDFLMTVILQYFLKNWTFLLNTTAMAIALAVCIFIGIIFGILPAMKAGRKDPIEALRYE
jgi:putative ABC transport system permease protein